MGRRWAPFVVFVATIYLTLPYGPYVGLKFLHTVPGAWFMTSGLMLLGGVAVGGFVVRLARRGAPPWAYPALLGTIVSYAWLFQSLRAAPLERVHLLEYGIAAWLAWWALSVSRSGAAGYAWATALAALAGLGDELLQLIVPGRYFDWRDVWTNVASAALGVAILAVLRAARPLNAAT